LGGNAAAAAASATSGPAPEPVIIQPDFVRGVSLLASDPGAAAAQFLLAAQNDPTLARAGYDAGVLLEGQGKPAEAQQAYYGALKARPDFVPAIVGLAGLVERGGGVADAERYLNEQIVRQPQAMALKTALAQLLARRGDLARAYGLGIVALHSDERDAQAFLALGMVYRRQKRFELAELALGQAIEVAPGLACAHNELGLTFLDRDDKPHAVQAFEKATRANGWTPAAFNNLGVLRTEVGAYPGAVVALTRATTLSPERAAYYVNLGNALRGDRKYAEAEQAYQKALQLPGSANDALFNLGILYLDDEVPGADLLARLTRARDYLLDYQRKAAPQGQDAALVTEYLAACEKGISGEEKRVARDKRRAEEKTKADQEKAKAAEEKAREQPPSNGEGVSPDPKGKTSSAPARADKATPAAVKPGATPAAGSAPAGASGGVGAEKKSKAARGKDGKPKKGTAPENR